ncbi:unnamed protein product [Echinostoma caproni]|uniref:Uncharacterized protein n=1 Tax=Echinostoma caproni TaxID=27848 RepID=A0A183B5D3_9TREM|nr:unnamed protein product [Echinostoma caproni]
MYHTPEGVVRAVLSLRESDRSYSWSADLDIFEVMKQSRYVRDRLTGLVPTTEQFESIFNPTGICIPPSGSPSRPRSQSILLDGHNGINRRSVVIQHIADGRNNDILHHLKSKLNSHLSNGLPEQMDVIDGRIAVKQLDFANILVKNKRPRSVSGLQPLESAKRRRVEDNGIQDGSSPIKPLNGPMRGNSPVNAFPFLGAELLTQLEKELADVGPLHVARKVPSPEHPLTLVECLQLQLFGSLSIWNLPRLYISRLPIHRLLCSCSAVIAKPPRPSAPSLQSNSSLAVHTCQADQPEHCISPYHITTQLSPPSCLSCAVNLLYRFTERSRWLSVTQSLPASHGFLNHCAPPDLTGLTPCGRLFLDSGKSIAVD